jgi:hypothetical protein
MMYGRSAQAGEDEVLFVYPFYSIFVFAPFALIGEYALARAVWMTALEISLLLTAGMSLSLARWRVSKVMLALLLVFTALWYHSLRPVINGNASVLCAFFITAAFVAIRSEHDVLGGFLLALASIKPQMVPLLFLFVIIWAISRSRWLLVSSLLASLAFLVGVTILLIPDWIFQNLRQILAYPGYTTPGSPGAIFTAWMPGVGAKLGWVVTVFAIGFMLAEWRAALHKDFNWFYWAACITLVLTNLSGIRTATENYIALYPALILVLAIWDQRWGTAGRWMVILSLLFLFGGLWWLFLSTIQNVGQPMQHPIMFFPLPLFLLAGLYWVRWWAVRPPPPLLDLLRRSHNIELV